MAGQCLYFVPGWSALSDEAASRIGLLSLLGESYSQRQTSCGPGDTSGVLVRSHINTNEPGYVDISVNKSTQKWLPFKDGDSILYYVGLDSRSVPTHKCLARHEQFSGHLITLCDGADWLAPVGRRFDGGVMFPARYFLDDDGKWKGEMLPEFMRYSKHLDRIWSTLISQAGGNTEDEPLTIAEGLDVAAELLGLNYRVTSVEVGMLGLFDDNSFRKVLGAFIDLPTIEKKTQAAIVDSSDGGEVY